MNKAGMSKTDWQDDPEIREAMRRRSVRNTVLRSAVIWTPPFVVCAALLVWFFVDMLLGGGRGTWFLLVVLTGFSALFGIRSYQSIADLAGEPQTLTGAVTRRWSRSDSFVMKSHYIRIGRQILQGDLYSLDTVKQGDRVEVTYYPHSAVIIALAKLPDEDSLPPREPQVEPA